jgi:hypothetical protein
MLEPHSRQQRRGFLGGQHWREALAHRMARPLPNHRDRRIRSYYLHLRGLARSSVGADVDHTSNINAKWRQFLLKLTG